MKLTAVEWLMQTLEQNNIIDLDLVDSDKYYAIIDQAKQMEAEQNKIPELSDEEIEEEYDLPSWVDGAKWYREQVKQKQ